MPRLTRRANARLSVCFFLSLSFASRTGKARRRDVATVYKVFVVGNAEFVRNVHSAPELDVNGQHARLSDPDERCLRTKVVVCVKRAWLDRAAFLISELGHCVEPKQLQKIPKNLFFSRFLRPCTASVKLSGAEHIASFANDHVNWIILTFPSRPLSPFSFIRSN